MAKSNVPAYVAQFLPRIIKAFHSYFKGTRDFNQCVDDVAEDVYMAGCGMMFTWLGQVVIPIPVLGALAGGFVGNLVGKASCEALKDCLSSPAVMRAEFIELLERYDATQKLLRESKTILDGLEKMMKACSHSFGDMNIWEIYAPLTFTYGVCARSWSATPRTPS